MPGTTETEELYAAIEEASAMLDVPCERERVWPLLAAYTDAIPLAMVAFRVASGARHTGELDCRISLPRESDPHGIALAEGFTTRTDHPVGSVLDELRDRSPVSSYGVDFGVAGGFKKIWAFFAHGDFQDLSELAAFPSFPRSLTENSEFFARHGLVATDLVGIDYHNRTMNVYFATKEGARLERDAVLAMHRDLGLPDPSEAMLQFCEQAFATYTTVSWDSPKVERISFSAMTRDPLMLPVQLGPYIERFVKNLPYGDSSPSMAHAAMSSSGEEYYKLQSYYKYRPHMVNLKPKADSNLDGA